MARNELSEEEKAHGRRLGTLLAERRVARGWSAPELARETDVSIDAIRSIEGGRVATPAFLTIARLARALGISLDSLHEDALAAMRGDSERSAPK